MRRKLDCLPRGVRWAVRILRLAGTITVLPGLFYFPFVLCMGAMNFRSASPWTLDLVTMVSAVPIMIGSAMRVTATCMELTHNPSALDSDCPTEWKNLANACLHLLSVMFLFVTSFCALQLASAWQENRHEILLMSVNLAFHLSLTVALHRGPYFLDRWFDKGRGLI